MLIPKLKGNPRYDGKSIRQKFHDTSKLRHIVISRNNFFHII